MREPVITPAHSTDGETEAQRGSLSHPEYPSSQASEPDANSGLNHQSLTPHQSTLLPILGAPGYLAFHF